MMCSSTSHSTTRRERNSRRSHHRLKRGFTLLELLITFVLVGIITTLSVPSMRSVTKTHEGLDSATHLAQHINIARDQAIRRNRAYEVVVNEMNPSMPQGVLLLSEAPANSCQSIIDQPEQVSALEVSVYGTSRVAQLPPAQREGVGIAGWRIGREGNYQSERVQLCFNARGALFKREGSLYTEVGLLQLGIQQFDGPPWIKIGRVLDINLTFSSGAQVQR